MLTETETKVMVDDLFEEEALALGGLVVIHEVPDDLVWRFIKTLDTLRERIHRQIESKSKSEAPIRHPNLHPHPAIEDFLLKLRRGPP
jgi:hypothetical protein